MKASNNQYFVNGSINIKMVAKLIETIKTNHQIGAHSIFLGQVRADKKGNSKVVELHYSAYKGLAVKQIKSIIENSFKKYKLSSLYILHSLGKVKTGEISLLIIVSSPHRKACISAVKSAVDELKSKVPIWKKEIFDDGTERWVG